MTKGQSQGAVRVFYELWENYTRPPQLRTAFNDIIITLRLYLKMGDSPRRSQGSEA